MVHEGRFGQLSTSTGTSSPLPSDLRECLTQALADMLVAEVQASQQVTAGTGVEGPLPARSPAPYQPLHSVRKV